MPTARDPEQLVEDFCAALSQLDAEALRPFFADDIVYHNIPMDPVVGIEAAIAFIDGFFGMCDAMAIETLHAASAGNVVLTERVDIFTVGDVSAPLPVMGTFEIRDGKIAAWRDYFDMGQVAKLLPGPTT
jgi:limonene-1,2-epoxide hydrolase